MGGRPRARGWCARRCLLGSCFLSSAPAPGPRRHDPAGCARPLRHRPQHPAHGLGLQEHGKRNGGDQMLTSVKSQKLYAISACISISTGLSPQVAGLNRQVLTVVLTLSSSPSLSGFITCTVLTLPSLVMNRSSRTSPPLCLCMAPGKSGLGV